jgi:soluble lytic murein transglycosylase
MSFRLTSLFKPMLLVAGLLPMTLNAAVGDEVMLEAKSAYDKKNTFALAGTIEQLKKQDYILTPYAEYWQMLLNLETASHQEVNDFLIQNATFPFADRLRGEWLKKLGKAKDWSAFLDVYSQYQQDDATVACYAAIANAEVNGFQTLEGVKSLWMQAKEQPSNCNAVYDLMQSSGVLTDEDVLMRFRLALSENRLSLAKAIAKRARGIDAAFIKKMDTANASPQLLINKKMLNAKSVYGRELYLYALNQIAKVDSIQALTAFKKIDHLFNAEEKSYFYAGLAFLAAKRHEPNALSWYKLADNTALSKDQLEWYARIALRQEDWKAVLEVTELMSVEQAEEPVWRYWRARALKANNQQLEANALFAVLTTERHFYGWLAQEELGPTMGSQPVSFVPNDAEVTAFARLEPVKRAEALQRLDFRWEAKLEWALATEGLEDRELITASEFASRKKWFDLAVATADKTTEVHNFSLRYPTPYRDLMRPAAKQQNIDEAWVYGIIRQESRFMHYAKSNVGAAGLMQVMPATAKWVANKAGWRDYHNGMIHDIDTNISLGTHYMKYTVDQFNGQEVMATAAYNAGPSRAKKWMAAKPLEGAIYAETIPFTETRNYVKKVMANAHLYAKQLGLEPVPLKKRLGVIPGSQVLSEQVNSEVNQ